MQITKTVGSLVLVSLVVLFSLGYTAERSAREPSSNVWYLLNIDGKPAGYLGAVGKVKAGDSAEVYFEHEILTDSKGKRVLLKMQSYCDNDDYLFPLKTSADIDERGQAPVTISATVEKEAAYGCSKGKMRIIYRKEDETHNLDRDIPEHTVTDAHLLEIVPRLPFVKGTVFKFNFFILDKLKVGKKHVIKYIGREELQVKGKHMSLHKFEQKGSGIKRIYYWVDEQHKLIRSLKDDKEELLLSSEAEVKRLFP